MVRVPLVALLLVTGLAFGAPKAPTSDIAGGKDHPALGRYEGSLIISYEHKRYEEFTIPLGSLVRVPGKTGPMNNALFKPRDSKTLEGAFTRITYLLPPDRSPLEVVRNYQQLVESNGGEVLFECKDAGCGGAADRSSEGGGGLMSLGMVLLPAARISDAYETSGHCATTERIKNQRYTAAAMNDGALHVAVHAYEVSPFTTHQSTCRKLLEGRTIANVYVLEQEAREQKMVVLEASEMADKITSTGSVALYGIYFDTDKAVVKAESEPTIAEIARLLSDNAGLKLLVVGHTDNQGAFDYNLDLSQRRADAVVSRLTADRGIAASRLRPVGVSYASPVAPNTSEDGRAKNRRVELVADSR